MKRLKRGMRMKPSTGLAVLCLLLIVSTPMLASAAKPSTKRLWAEGYSALAILMTQEEEWKAVEGIHVKESLVGPFDLIVVYNMTSMDPASAVPWKIFVDSPYALPLLVLVFNDSRITVVGSITVSKVGLHARVEMGYTSLVIDALTPVRPQILSFHFPGETGRYALDVRGMHFPAVASVQLGQGLVSEGQDIVMVAWLTGFLVQEARIELNQL
ncbi:MAG: hypothetical protein QW057_00040 [Candidatus Bathyarchaeia archaeon]